MRTSDPLTGRFKLSILAASVALAASLAPFIVSGRCYAQEAPATFPVDGVVENSLTHQSVARALVECNSTAVLTDSEGRFELHLPEGAAYLRVRRPGYQGPETNRPVQQRVNVSAKTQPVTVFLTPVASIAGHVALSSGDPAAGLQITLNRKQIESGHLRWRSVGNSTTDNDGTFRLPALAAPGSYVLCIASSPDRFIPSAPGAPSTTIMGYPGACYPGGFDLKTALAAPLTLVPGQQAQLDILLTRQPFYSVSISVAGSSPREHMGVTIFDRSGRPANAGMRFSNETGAFELHLPNGGYYAESRGGRDPQLYGRADFTVAGGPVSGVTVVPAPVAPIPVEIREEFTANLGPAPGGRVAIGRLNGSNGEQAPVQISFDSVDRPLNGQAGGNMRRDPGSADTFHMDAPQQGAYLVDVRPFDRQVYAASITSGSTDLLHEPLIVGPGGNVQPIRIVLRNDTGFLQCTMKADAALAPNGIPDWSSMIPVAAIPIGDGSRRIYPSYARDARVQAAPLPLPPGKYLVVAFEKEPEIDLDDADALSRLAARGQTVTVQPGATVSVQIDPISDGDEEAAQ
jgi:hypothetical protein